MTQVARHIVITGLMGAGKTTIGQALAERTGRPWRDSDADIEAATGLTVRELRDREGVDAMHAREASQLLDALADPEPSVISAAASIVDDARCRAALAEPDVAAVWLHAAPDTLAERFESPDEHRPAYGESTAGFLADQATRREPLAEAAGAHIVDTNGLTEPEVVARVLEVLASIEP